MKNYDQAMKKVDKVIALKTNQMKLVHELKMSLFRDKLVDSHDNEFWIDKIPKKEAKIIFDKFLALWENAKEEKFDRYERKTREYHFENFKAVMIWDYRKNKKRLLSN